MNCSGWWSCHPAGAPVHIWQLSEKIKGQTQGQLENSFTENSQVAKDFILFFVTIPE